MPSPAGSSLPTQQKCDFLSGSSKGPCVLQLLGIVLPKTAIAAASCCQYENASRGCGVSPGLEYLGLAGGWICLPLVLWVWTKLLAGRHGTTPA